jgi:hypothetical protein
MERRSQRRAVRFVSAWIRRHPIVSAAVIALAWMLTLVIVLEPRFATNDDPAMMDMARGAFSYPSARLVFINVLVGGVMRVGYSAVPELAWYALVLYALQYLAVATLVYSLLTHEWMRPRTGVLLGLAVIAVFHVQMLVLLQFTSTAMLLGVAGAVLFSRRAALAAGSPLRAAVAGGVFGAASLVRFNAMLGVLALTVPFLVVAATRIGRDRTLAFAGAAVSVVLAGMALQAWAYDVDPDWETYRRFNALRGELHDGGRLVLDDALEAGLGRIGWSENDLHMFRAWFFTDESVYTTAALEELIDASEHRASRLIGLATAQSLVSSTEPWAVPWRRHSRELGLAVALGVAALLTVRGASRLVIASGLSWGLTLLAALVAAGRLPGRVSMPLIMAMALLVLLEWQAATPPRSLAGLVVIALLTVLFASAAYSVTDEAIARSRQHAIQTAQLTVLYERLHAFDPDGVFVSWVGGLPQHWMDPLSDPGALAPVRRVGLGWPTHSPHHRRQLERYGIGDLPHAIAEEGHVYLLTRRFDVVGLFERYVYEHHGLEGCLRPVFRPGSGIVVWDRVVGADELADAGLDEDRRRCLDARAQAG